MNHNRDLKTAAHGGRGSQTVCKISKVTVTVLSPQRKTTHFGKMFFEQGNAANTFHSPTSPYRCLFSFTPNQFHSLLIFLGKHFPFVVFKNQVQRTVSFFGVEKILAKIYSLTHAHTLTHPRKNTRRQPDYKDTQGYTHTRAHWKDCKEQFLRDVVFWQLYPRCKSFQSVWFRYSLELQHFFESITRWLNLFKRDYVARNHRLYSVTVTWPIKYTIRPRDIHENIPLIYFKIKSNLTLSF